jgi:DNA-binding response OmpR family regulator
MQDINRCALVVEDELLVAMVASDALTELGFRAIEAPSAAKALELAEENKSDIVLALVDLGLPDSPGEELVSKLRARYPLLPIIVASGRGTSDIDAGLRALQNMIILPKPYDFEELRRAIENLERSAPPK